MLQSHLKFSKICSFDSRASLSYLEKSKETNKKVKNVC